MGIPELMANRVTDGYKSLARKEDITSVTWNSIDAVHAEGSFDFDAFYGQGRVEFKALKSHGKWVICYMAIPRKSAAESGAPYVVFDLSEDSVEK